MAKYFYSAVKQRAVLLLAAGVALGFYKHPKSKRSVWTEFPKAWEKIGKETLRRIMEEFKYKRLIDFKENKDGSINIILTKLGEKHAVKYDPENIRIPTPAKWDKKWRVVIFDIPEKKRKIRDTLRHEMKKLGFFELQKSTWVFPYDCRDAVDFLIELYEARNFVRYIVTSEISYDADLRLHFDLT